MHWLQTLDVELFRFIHGSLVNPVFEAVMPLASGNVLFVPVVVLAVAALVWKGRARGVICVLMLALILPLGEGLVLNTLKQTVARLRPYVALPDVHRPNKPPNSWGVHPPPMAGGETSVSSLPSKGDMTSMPSSHAANWFAATMVLFVY